MRVLTTIAVIFLITYFIGSQFLRGPSMAISTSELKADPRLPTFADAQRSLSDSSFELPEAPKPPPIKRDPEREKLRKETEQAVNVLQRAPCDPQAKINAVAVTTAYAKTFCDQLDCRWLWFCSNEKINKAAFSKTTPEDFDLWISLLKLSDTGAITARDFSWSLSFPIKLWVKDKSSGPACFATAKS